MNFGKEIKRAIRTAEGRRRIFFRFFLLIVLGNVFYFPEGYADRFFTPGMLWTGIAVGVSGMLFPFVVSGRVGLPGLAWWAESRPVAFLRGRLRRGEGLCGFYS